MTRFSILILLLISRISLAQFNYKVDQTIPVKNMDGGDLQMPWGAGLNASQFNTMDLNGDGIEDLVLFDRMADKVITFLRVNNEYKYTPEFEILFPKDLTRWMLLRDYNCDGKKDIFTGNVFGIKVYLNTTENGENLSWKHFQFYTGGSTKSEVLMTKGSAVQKINLQLMFDDLPAIADADNDGDLDIFNMEFLGETVEFHQNLSIENGWGCDSLEFKRVTQNWGNFKECRCGTFAFNGEECPPDGGRTKHISGKTLSAFDSNGDQKIDLVFSEGECSHLFLLPNEGSALNPVINSSSEFPSSHPVDFEVFPAAFFEDVDFDGKKDLISTPNLFQKEEAGINFRQSSWFYKNTGTNSSPVFDFVQNNFLQQGMIDVGDNAKPAFFDIDGDEDLDLLISNNTASESLSSEIFLYENIGTETQPAFQLVDEDFLGFSQRQFYNLKIQFSDINRDNTTDLVFTATDIQTNATDLHFISNKSQTILDVSGQRVTDIDFVVFYDDNLLIADVDLDGRPDILAGRETALQFWRNTGTGPQFIFSLADGDFLGLSSAESRSVSCAIGDLDNDGAGDLVFGDQLGKIHIVSDFRNAGSAPEIISDVVYNPLLTSYTEQNFGGRVRPVVANLYDEDKRIIVAGNVLGGLQILRNDGGKSLPNNPVISVYPNPWQESKILKLKIDRAATVQVVTVLGQQINSPIALEAHELYDYDMPPLSKGIYLLKFTVEKKSYTRRLIIL